MSKQSLQDTIEQQMQLISKGAAQIVGEEELRLKLDRSIQHGIPLRVKLGLDPSAPDLHLGHAVVLRKARQFQNLGHHVIIVLGDFTGRIGDPTGKTKGRQALSKEKVLENAQTYADQLSTILDPEKTEIRFNSEWLSHLTFEQVIQLSQTTTLARMLERDDFKNRFLNQSPIGLHEFFYPLMQAQDSVAIQADVELGGTDQTFNILMGRTLQKSLGLEAQVALFMPLLEGLDGVEKMSKSLGNAIGLHEPIQQQFKKLMEIPDALILKFFDLATDLSPQEIVPFKVALDHGDNPRGVKLALAKTVLALYHAPADVEAAERFFIEAHTLKQIPETLDRLSLPEQASQVPILELAPMLIQMKVIPSSSQWRRLIEQNGVKVNQMPTNLTTIVHSGDVLQVGKRHFFRVC